ncbi:hypothetical protein [Streptomyces liangshanensis]
MTDHHELRGTPHVPVPARHDHRPGVVDRLSAQLVARTGFRAA